MSLSRRDIQRLRAAGWEVIEDGLGVRVRRALWRLVSGRSPAPTVGVVPARRRSR